MMYYGREIIEATSGTLIRGSADKGFTAISTDTREAQAGKLFIPLTGPRFEGHSFIPVAVQKGAAGVLLREGEEERLQEVEKDITAIRVPDTLSALGAIARFWRKKFPIPVAAVTGSSGKTTTKEMISHIMAPIRNLLKTEGNYNNLIGLPLTLLTLNETHEMAILEMGTNAPGEIGQLSRIAGPDVGLITNIGPAHLSGLKTLENIREEKGELFRHLSHHGIAVVNQDDEAVRMAAERWSGARVTYGLKGRCDVTAEDMVSSGKGLTFTLVLGDWRGRVAMAPHNVMNAVAAAATSLALGAEKEVICRGLSTCKSIPGRMELHRLCNGVFLVNDSYNANPVSVKEALMTLRTWKGKQKATVILGDMLELGERSEELHEEVGELIAATGVHRLFLKGDFSRSTATGAARKGMPASRIHVYSDAEDVLKRLSRSIKKDEWILVKGSRAMKMETVITMMINKFGLQDDPDIMR